MSDNNDNWTTVKSKPKSKPTGSTGKASYNTNPQSSQTYENGYGFEHQDLNPVVFTKTGSQRKDAVFETVNKGVSNSNSHLFTSKKLDEDLPELKYIGELGKKFQQARSAKGLTQKDLAKQLNMDVKVYQEIESGKAVYNGQVVGKIKRKLGVKV